MICFMKKYLILCFLVCCTLNSTFAQKKGVKTATAKSTPVFAKIDNLIAEVKNGNFQVTIVDKGKEVGALIVQQADKNFSPIGTKLASFKAAGTTLYLLTWTEKRINKTDLKTEEITLVYNVVYEINNKKQVFSNTQTTTNTTEKVFLDRNKTASETQQRVRREGFEFTLNPDGSIVQRSKNQENKWVYDATKMEYIDAKKKK